MTSIHEPGAAEDVARYLRSGDYESDLAASQVMWSAPGLVEAAGSFVLLTYFANPRLLAVRAGGGPGVSLRTAIDGHREREFLHGIIGIGPDGGPGAGIRDSTVLRTVERLRERHLLYPGMTASYMKFIGGLLAIAPLRLRAHRAQRLSAPVNGRYWRYIAMVMRLLAADLGTAPATDRSCRRFDRSTAMLSPEGRVLILGFAGRHPRHVEHALPLLFPASRQVVERTLAGRTGGVAASRLAG
jgi:hypothetical protein